MDVRLSPQLGGLASRPVGGAAAASRAAGAASGAGGSFGSAFESALKSVSAAQGDASSLQREVMLDNPKVSLEQTMVAMQKAQIGFQSALHVRNRMVQAYSDIMNMQV